VICSFHCILLEFINNCLKVPKHSAGFPQNPGLLSPYGAILLASKRGIGFATCGSEGERCAAGEK
jgi:hypothetical protein